MPLGCNCGSAWLLTEAVSKHKRHSHVGKKAALELAIVHADTPTLLGNLASNGAATPACGSLADNVDLSRHGSAGNVTAGTTISQGGASG